MKTTLAYAGRRVSSKNTVLYGYAEAGVDELGFYSKPLIAGLTVGTEIEVTKTDTGVKLGGDDRPRIIGQTEDDAAVVTWAAEDRAAQTMLADVALQKRLAKQAVDPLDDALDVLRQAMRSTRGVPARTALLRYIETYILG